MEELRIDESTREIIWRVESMLQTPSKALACHCECLGMNAENMWAAISNQNPLYRSQDYYRIMEKWGLLDEEGNSLI